MESSEKDFLNPDLTRQMHEIGYDGPTLMHAGELHGILKSAAFRWFREKYGLHCGINTHTSSTNQTTYVIDLEFGKKLTYEEAESACLDKLIEIVESKSE